MGFASAAWAQDPCEGLSQLQVISAEDDGSFDESYGPGRAVDGKFDADSRWSSKDEKLLTLDLGEPQLLKEAGFAFYKGNERRSLYRLEASADGETYTTLIEDGISGGTTTEIERVDFEDIEARYLRFVGMGNEGSGWNSLLEVQAFGCGSGEIAYQGDGSEVAKVAGISMYGLKTDVPPSENFDLSKWKITLPVDQDGDGKADEIEEGDLEGWSDPDFFYTDPATGGMVFRVAVNDGATTPNSSYLRSELREMIRGGDESISTRIDDGTPNKNNWVFSSAPVEAKELAGGVDGVMTARLAVNQVTRTGEEGKVGRVIIGQIHAKDDEPIRLYYRKLPQNKFGSIYFAHEPSGEDDLYVEVIGERGHDAANPEDGIALDEVFSYEIRVTSKERDGVKHPLLQVSITRDDGSVVDAEYDMTDSGFSHDKDFMYFKAGAYSQNDTSVWPERDFDQVTFYELNVEHD